jgi:hypothetical protein
MSENIYPQALCHVWAERQTESVTVLMLHSNNRFEHSSDGVITVRTAACCG